MAQPPEPVASREPLVALFSADRATHPYGLADLEEPFWTGSRWWLDGDACVGLLRLPASDVPVVYSVSARAPAETLDLLVRVLPELPDHFIINGPPGLSDRLAGDYDAVWVRSYRKMHLAHPDRLPPPDPEAEPLSRTHLDELTDLYDSAPDPGTFFAPELLDTGYYVGLRESGVLVSSAGVHVVSRRHGVAALGNIITHPAHRRTGLGRRATVAVCHRLLADVDLIGLNVGQDNPGAENLYQRIGFEPVVPYEEAELVRRR